MTSQKVAEIRTGRMEEVKLMSKDEREEFMSLFPQLVKDLTEIPEYRDMPDVNKWFARMLQYNVPHGKRNRYLILKDRRSIIVSLFLTCTICKFLEG
jgi:hypothetical protein